MEVDVYIRGLKFPHFNPSTRQSNRSIKQAIIEILLDFYDPRILSATSQTLEHKPPSPPPRLPLKARVTREGLSYLSCMYFCLLARVGAWILIIF